MPGFIAHHLFGQKTKKLIKDENILKCIKKNKAAYNLGLQGPDIFYYNIDSYIRPGKNPGSREHDENTDAFLLNLARSLSLFPSPYDYECAISYLAGFYAHYTLDRICHPFIFARTFYDFNDSKNYLGSHYQYETDLDALYLMKEKGICPSAFRGGDKITVSKEQADIINTMLSYAHRKTYGKLSLRKNEARRSAYSMKKILPLLADSHGIKKFILSGIERSLFGAPYLSGMITSDQEIRFKDPENMSHNIWKSPWDKSVKRCEDFYELIDIAYREYQKITPLLNDLMRHKAKITETTAEHFH